MQNFAGCGSSVGGIGSCAGKLLQMVGDVAGGFEGAFGRGFVPGFGDWGAALVADAAVIGREARLRRRIRPAIRLGERLREAITSSVWFGRFHSSEIGGFRVGAKFFFFSLSLSLSLTPCLAGEFEFDRIHPAAEQMQLAVVFGFVTRLDPGVDQWCSCCRSRRAANGVLGADDELVVAGIGGEQGALPA